MLQNAVDNSEYKDSIMRICRWLQFSKANNGFFTISIEKR